MNISGLRPYAGFYEYNSIKAAELRTQQIAAVQMSSAGDALSENQAQPSQTYAGDEKSKQNFGALDYAQQYQPDATYDLKGSGIAAVSVFCRDRRSGSQKDKRYASCFAAFRRELLIIVHNTQRRDLCAHFFIRMNIWIPRTI